MLVSIKSMIGAPVMSLQTGRRLATVGEPIINPHNLKIMAFYVHGPLVDYDPAVLFADDIRELGKLGAIVDSADNIMSPDGLVRLEKILAYNFSFTGIKVFDDHKRKLGAVESYAFDSKSFMVQLIMVQPVLSMRLSIASLSIKRQQIIELDNQKMIVRAPSEKVQQSKPVAEIAGPGGLAFENPFRKPESPAPQSKTAD
jgi:uncharacterized protein YrrD